MNLSKRDLKRIGQVAHARDLNFVQLVKLGGVDRRTAFRGAVLRDVDMRDQDLTGFNFCGTSLPGCDLRGTDLSGTMGLTAEALATARIDETTRLPRGRRDGFWVSGFAPFWADQWGSDRFGLWVAFSVVGADGKRVSQRLRWCPPGSFLMGSEKEAGRDDDEGPRHRVTLAAGFWMFETSCTEELWAAVMKRPGSLGIGGLPITNVSWEDAQAFVAALNATRPGLGLSLPSEAQWEYAYRAGTNTPYNFGKEVTKEQVDVDGDGPVLVGSLPANAWGLHEMHGNVWEWCADTWHDSHDGAPRDGSAWIDEGAANRVVRGGAFNVTARNVRSAYRLRSGPGARYVHLGFRCARVQVGEAEPSGLSAEPAQAGFVLRFGMPSSRFRPPLEPLTRWREPIPGLPEEAWPDMITLPAGEFVMGAPEDEVSSNGDERPQRRVTVPRPFALGRTAVTFAMWDAAMAVGFVPPSGTEPPEDHGWGRDDRPVINISWHDAQAYCRWLNQRLALPPGTYRLPSEAEWEYACRAGRTTPFSFGETISTKQANYDGRYAYGQGRKGEYRGRTVPVGSLPANAWGLHEMHGNVWEWVEDAKGPYPAQATDASPLVNADSSSRVLRGGSWNFNPQFLRSAIRHRLGPLFLNGGIGFRVARTLG